MFKSVDLKRKKRKKHHHREVSMYLHHHDHTSGKYLHDIRAQFIVTIGRICFKAMPTTGTLHMYWHFMATRGYYIESLHISVLCSPLFLIYDPNNKHKVIWPLQLSQKEHLEISPYKRLIVDSVYTQQLKK